MRPFSNVTRFFKMGNIGVNVGPDMAMTANDATAAEWLAAKPKQVGKPRRNKALAAMKRENRKKNR